MADNDTIVAVSTPAGRAGRLIVRLSGPEALPVAAGLFAAGDGRGLSALPGWRWTDGRALPARGGPPARLYLMRAPRSYTRQDVAELHLPGVPPLAELALEAALAAGARLAVPGEFTRRALLSGRISLDQAAAVLELIGARSRGELAAAAEALSGAAGRRLAAWLDRAEDLAARCEAELDCADSAGEFLSEAAAAAELAELAAELAALAARRSPAAGTGRTDPGRARAALAGPVGAGKSLLFRRLTGRPALVSGRPGTTRDVLEAPLLAAPRDLALLDSAGLGAAAGGIELLARQAAERAWRSADLVLLVVDRAALPDPAALEPALAAAAGKPLVLVLNKSDLPASPLLAGFRRLMAGRAAVAACAEVSAFDGAGCRELSGTLAGLVRAGMVERSAARISGAVQRGAALESARAALARAGAALAGGLGLACAADDLQEALRHLARQFRPGCGRAQLDERVLERLFARFCVGK